MPGFRARLTRRFAKKRPKSLSSILERESEAEDVPLLHEEESENEERRILPISRTNLKSFHTGCGDAGYTVAKVRKLPKLHRAVWKCKVEKVMKVTKKMKIKKLNAYDKHQRTALHLACSKAHSEIIIHLCALHVDVNLRDAEGASPMHKLIETRNTACLQLLINCGGNANLTDKFGRSPLHLVARTGDTAACAILLRANIVVDSTDKNGMTALHMATLYGHLELVMSLVNYGFYVDAQDGYGRTSLMIAAGEGHVNLLKLLVEKKADTYKMDKNQYKAIDYAMMKNHPECVKVIEDHEDIMMKFESLFKAESADKSELYSPTDCKTKVVLPGLQLSGDVDTDTDDGDDDDCSSQCGALSFDDESDWMSDDEDSGDEDDAPSTKDTPQVNIFTVPSIIITPPDDDADDLPLTSDLSKDGDSVNNYNAPPTKEADSIPQVEVSTIPTIIITPPEDDGLRFTMPCDLSGDGDSVDATKKSDSAPQVEVSAIPTIIITPPEDDGTDDICTESEPLADECESEENDDERPTLWTFLVRSTSPQDGLFLRYDEESGDESDSDLESEEEDECTDEMESEITAEEKKSEDFSSKLKATTANVDVIINEGDEPRIATLADMMVIPTIVITPPLDDATTTPKQQPPAVILKPSDDLPKVVNIEGTPFKATSAEDLLSCEKYGLQLTRDPHFETKVKDSCQMTETKDDQMVCKESERSDPKDAAIENALVPLNTETDASLIHTPDCTVKKDYRIPHSFSCVLLSSGLRYRPLAFQYFAVPWDTFHRHESHFAKQLKRGLTTEPRSLSCMLLSEFQLRVPNFKRVGLPWDTVCLQELEEKPPFKAGVFKELDQPLDGQGTVDSILNDTGNDVLEYPMKRGGHPQSSSCLMYSSELQQQSDQMEWQQFAVPWDHDHPYKGEKDAQLLQFESLQTEKHKLKCAKNHVLFDYGAVEEDNVSPVCEHAASEDNDLNVLESDNAEAWPLSLLQKLQVIDAHLRHLISMKLMAIGTPTAGIIGGVSTTCDGELQEIVQEIDSYMKLQHAVQVTMSNIHFAEAANWKSKYEISVEKLNFQMEMFVLEEDGWLKELEAMEDKLKSSTPNVGDHPYEDSCTLKSFSLLQ